MGCTCYDVGPMCGYCQNEVQLQREAKRNLPAQHTEQERRRYALLQAATTIYTQDNQTVDVAVSRATQLLHVIEEQEKA